MDKCPVYTMKLGTFLYADHKFDETEKIVSLHY